MTAPSCRICHGRGMVTTRQETFFGPALTRKGCPACNPEPPVLKGSGRPESGEMAAAARSLTAFLARPENQAYLAGCVLTAGFAPRRISPWAGIVMTICGGLAARQAYLTARDIASIARAGNGPDPTAA